MAENGRALLIRIAGIYENTVKAIEGRGIAFDEGNIVVGTVCEASPKCAILPLLQRAGPYMRVESSHFLD